MKKIAAVTVLYNPTKKIIQNISGYIDKVDKVYVIDNSNDSNKKLLIDNKKIEYLPNYTNLGISNSLNKACNLAIDEGYEFLLTMDQDSLFEKNEFQKMIDYINKSDLKKVAIVSPNHNVKGLQNKETSEIDHPLEVMTSGNIINLKLYKKIGKFREEYFIDDVDIEYGLRLNKMGYQIDRLNYVLLNHHLGDTKSKIILGHQFVYSNHNPQRRYYMTRNTLKLCDEYQNDFPEYCDYLKRGLFGQAQNIILFEKDKFKKLKGMHNGYKDYKNNISGKQEGLKSNKSNLLLLIVFAIIFFSLSEIITWDSAHYFSYIDIFEGQSPISSWDIVRGPVFPAIIYLSNFFFGKTVQGILITQFICYLINFFIIDYFLNVLFRGTKHYKFKKIIYECILLLNPIILGYYHVLLTEFVSITLTMISIFFGYLLTKSVSRKERILYGLHFVITITLSYFLKQPYLCCTLLPLLLSILISLSSQINLKKILDYSIIVLSSILLMFISIKIWNNYLKDNNVNMNTGRDTSSIFASQLLNGVMYFSKDENYDFTDYQGDELFSDSEKQKIKNALETNEDIMVISIYKKYQIIDKDIIIKNQSDNLSATSVLKEIAKTFFKYPILTIANYSKNYCALTSLCKISSPDGVNYYVANGFDLFSTYENETIAGKLFREGDNEFYMLPEMKERISFYSQHIVNTPLIKLENSLKPITNILYKFSLMVLLPFLIIILSTNLIFKKCKFKNKNIYNITILLLSTAFLGVLANALSGSVIDRYSVEFFIPALTGEIFAVKYLIDVVKMRSKYEKR